MLEELYSNVAVILFKYYTKRVFFVEIVQYEYFKLCRF